MLTVKTGVKPSLCFTPDFYGSQKKYFEFLKIGQRKNVQF